MVLEIPANIAVRVDEQTLKLDLAVGMYAANRLTLGQGACLCGLSQREFQLELGRRRIHAHYGLDDLAQDLAGLPQEARG